MSDSEARDDPRSDGSGLGTEVQAEAGIASSVELSLPKHVVQHESAPKVPGYVLTELAGEGVYGQVWRAWQLRTRKEVAVKIFLHRSGLDWIFLQREVERLMRLDRHPHIVTLLDAELDADPPFYVVDLLEGGSLQQFVDPQAPAPRERAIHWMEQIGDALGYVHAKGLIHCDVKPANVLVDDQDNVRVVDFGQSRVFTESAASLGTLFYMAPEQAVTMDAGEPVQPDVRWDVYAFGATAYAILTGRVPHGSDENTAALAKAETLIDRLSRYREMARKPPGGEIDSVGAELAAVVRKCISPNPDDRYNSMAEVQADLRALRENRPVTPLAHSTVYRIRKYVRRNPFGVGLMAAVAVLVGVLAIAPTIRSRLNEATARAILTAFVADPADAMARRDAASERVKGYLQSVSGQAVVSKAYTERIMGARAAIWSNPEAFWQSVDGGPLWENGEWLELARVAWPEPHRLIAMLAQQAATGSDRQKYVAFCLLGGLGEAARDRVALCTSAVTTESHAGVVAAAWWAADQLGGDVRSATSKDLLVDEVSGLAFARLPGTSSFRRGSEPDEEDRWDDESKPAEGVAIRPLYVSRTEVTHAAFDPFIRLPANEGLWLEAIEAAAKDGIDARGPLPDDPARVAVSFVHLAGAKRYCAWLSEQAKQAGSDHRYRLLTEDEWEYACRGGNEGRFCFGNDTAYARYFATCNGTKAAAFQIVAQRRPNWYGLFDMHGGLWELCSSLYAAPSEETGNRSFYALRGGAFYSPPARCRSAQRNYATADGAARFNGFRLVLEVDKP